VTALIASVLLIQQPALFRYIAQTDPSYECEPAKAEMVDGEKIERVRLTSLDWKGGKWQHELTIHFPSANRSPGACLLWVTGDKGKADPDAKLAKFVASSAGIVVAVLYSVPNQPLFENLREDALIAYSFQKFLQDKDETWPALFPMAKSVVSAMNAVVKLTAGSSDAVRRFVLSGESKRGWTCYLAGAYDGRVVGIAPMAFDFLGFQAQLAHQKALWGRFSPMFGAYEGLEPDKALGTDIGKTLVSMVDPLAYRLRLNLPKMIIRGANDPFWTVDAANLYANDLPGGRWFCVLPNVGHVVSTSETAQRGLAFFCRVEFLGEPAPILRGEWTKNENGWVFSPIAPGAVTVRLWAASAKDNDFSKCEWKAVRTGNGAMPLPNSLEPQAAFCEAVFRTPGGEVSLTTIPRIFGPAITNR